MSAILLRIIDLSSLSDTTLNGSTANGYVLDVNLSEFLSVGLDYVDIRKHTQGDQSHDMA